MSQERIKRKRTLRRRYRTRALFYLGCLVVMIGLFVFAIGQNLFAFGQLAVEGNNAMTAEEIRRTGAIREPINLFTVNKGEIEETLCHDPRIAAARVTYEWPNYLKVAVTERRGIAYVPCSYEGFAQIDRDGFVVSVGRGIRDGSAPLVSGVDIGNVFAGDTVHGERVKPLLTFLGDLAASPREEIAEVIVEDNAQVKVVLQNNLLVLLGKLEGLQGKEKDFSTICEELKSKQVKARYVDLTFKNPYIKLE